MPTRPAGFFNHNGLYEINIPQASRVEVVRGPGSALYGSEGVGGVVQIFLRKGREGFHPYASATVGSEQYTQTAAGLQAGQGALTYAAGLQRTRAGGFSFDFELAATQLGPGAGPGPAHRAILAPTCARYPS